MDKDQVKAMRQWFKDELIAIRATYGRSQDPFARGIRRELSIVQGAFEKILRGEEASHE